MQLHFDASEADDFENNCLPKYVSKSSASDLLKAGKSFHESVVQSATMCLISKAYECENKRQGMWLTKQTIPQKVEFVSMTYEECVPARCSIYMCMYIQIEHRAGAHYTYVIDKEFNFL